MVKKAVDFLSGVPATIISGVFLLISLIFSTTLKIHLPFDPAWITVALSGIPLLYLALWRIIRNKGISKISSALLITIAMFAAIAIGDLFAAGEVAWIMALGAILEEKTTERAKKGLKKLISLAPTCARRINGDKEETIPADQIKKGDLLRVLPGETIAVDATIIDGESSVDQSVITGESMPVDKQSGDEVFCGTVNLFGAIDIKATKVGEDSSLQKLIRLVQSAENKKAPMAKTADKAASFLVPLALLIAVLALVFTGDIVRAVTVLVVFCPCALVLATPTAVMAAIGQATKHGVIVKSGEALEKMSKVNTVAFDKTGTLTHGSLEVCDIFPFNEQLSEAELLSLAASAEAKSEHPLGKAVVRCAKKNGALIQLPDAFRMCAGRGVFATLGQKELLCGNESFLAENNIFPTESEKAQAENLLSMGKAVVYIAESGNCIGIIALSDKLRPQAKEAVAELYAMDMDVVLLTGDNEKTAKHFAALSGVKSLHAQLLPEDKVSCICAMEESGKRVCMVGDGINDAPALKTADVGIAMGNLGSDIAVEAADIALMSDDISRLAYLKRLSDATVKTIKFSICLSMCINFIAVTLSVLNLLNPTTGALVHNAGSCFVVLIAALLYDRKFD